VQAYQRSKNDFDELLLTGKIFGLPPLDLHPNEIASSVNLNCIDFYPRCSGKKNCCLYLASKFFPEHCRDARKQDNRSPEQNENERDGTENAAMAEFFLSKHAICICDDDNDLEMAMACSHAYLPSIGAKTMKEIVSRQPSHFTQTFAKKSVAAAKKEGSNGNSNNSSSKDDYFGVGVDEDGGDNYGEQEEEIVIAGTDASDLALAMILNKLSNS